MNATEAGTATRVAGTIAMEPSQADWPHQIYASLRAKGVSHFCYVPDAGHRVLIELAQADPEVDAIPLTCEEEGIGILAGVDLGGGKAVLLMQSSGVGNCINMLSLIKHGHFPLLTLVTMRGDFGEQNPWQYAMGQAVEPVLHAMGVITLRANHKEEVIPMLDASFNMVHSGRQAVALLLTQRLIGAKKF